LATGRHHGVLVLDRRGSEFLAQRGRIGAQRIFVADHGVAAGSRFERAREQIGTQHQS
jgi:hypothetical protein